MDCTSICGNISSGSVAYCFGCLLSGMKMEDLDLVDEMEWEDSEKVEFLTLEEAGLEDSPCMDTVPYALNTEYFRGEQ